MSVVLFTEKVIKFDTMFTSHSVGNNLIATATVFVKPCLKYSFIILNIKNSTIDCLLFEGAQPFTPYIN